MPKISVIITAHNYGKYIQQSIESVLRQTFDDFEIIVVNDGSTDNTEEILKKYHDHQKIKVVTLSNKGLAAASNRGIAASCGEYVIRLDADDFFDENILLVESRILDSKEDVGMVFPDYYRVDMSGEILECVRLLKVNDEVKLLDRSPLAAGALFRRSCYDAVGGYDETLRYQEDYDFWVRFIDKFRVYNVNLPLLYYRQHADNMSRNQEARMTARRSVKKHFVEKKDIRKGHTTLCLLPVIAFNRYKNKLALEKIHGKPLIAYVLQEALHADLIDRCVVDTDDKEIAAVARKIGADVPFIRPEHLAKPSTTQDMIARHCLDVLAKMEGYQPDILMTLYYNCPMIKEKHITEALDTMLLYDVDSVISVTEDLTFHWQPGEFGLKPVIYQKRLLREDKTKTYKEAGGIMVAKVPQSGFQAIIGQTVSFIELQPYEAIKIESEYDQFMFEQLVMNKWQTKTEGDRISK